MIYKKEQIILIDNIINNIKYIKTKNKKLYNELMYQLREKGDITLAILNKKDVQAYIDKKVDNIKNNNKYKMKYMVDTRTVEDMTINCFINKFFEYLYCSILRINNVDAEVINENFNDSYTVTNKPDITVNNDKINDFEVQAQMYIKNNIYVKKKKLKNMVKQKVGFVCFDKKNLGIYYKINYINIINIDNLEVRKDNLFGGKEYYVIPLYFFKKISYL